MVHRYVRLAIISILQFWIADLFAYKENVDDLTQLSNGKQEIFFFFQNITRPSMLVERMTNVTLPSYFLSMI